MEILGEFTTSLVKALGEIDKSWEEYDGLVVCGSHSPTDIEERIEKIKEAGESGRPFLGICHGHQLAAIQWARANGILDATSEEFGEGTFVVKRRDQLDVGLLDGETYWSNYAVAIDWQKPDYFFTTPSHPEYQSSKHSPHPLLVNFLKACKKAT